MNRGVVRSGLRADSAGLLAALDIVGLFAAYNVAYRLQLDQWPSPFSGSLWVLVAVAILALYVMDVYRVDGSRDPVGFSLDAFIAVFLVAAASVLVGYIFGVSDFKPIFGREVLPAALGMFAIPASLSRWVFVKWYENTLGVQHWLMVGSEDAVEHLNGYIRTEALRTKPPRDITWFSTAASLDQVTDWLGRHPERSCIVHDGRSEPELYLVEQLGEPEKPVTVLTITEYYEQYWKKLPVVGPGGDWLHSAGHGLMPDRTGFHIKRVVDLLVATIALVVALPLMLLVAVLIRLHSPGRVIYRQQRVGLNEKVFTLYKFRTMIDGAEKSGAQWSDVDDPRITRLGKLLRATRIDELPQLWNLILGNMSLIGPRPERPEFVSRLKQKFPSYQMRHMVPPGITGWAQVKYSYGSSIEDARHKLEYDLYYIKNHSVRLDMAIVMKTVIVVLRGLGR